MIRPEVVRRRLGKLEEYLAILRGLDGLDAFRSLFARFL